MKITLLKRRLGGGCYDLVFRGVAEGRGERRKPFVWTLENEDGILEIISGTTPSVGSVCGELLHFFTCGDVGIESDTDAALGQHFHANVSFDNDRRVIVLTAADGRQVRVTNALAGE